MDVRTIFSSVNNFEDWASYGSRTADSESPYLENKEVDIDLHKAKPSEIGDFKLRIAKEMAAFANTDSGIIALGINSNLQVSNKTTSLEDWLDRSIRDMIEPQLAGIDFKTCADTAGKEFVLVYIPKGNVMPYRVSSVKSCEKEKKNLREYFQRIGTNSVPIPMPIVRSLYLSNERSVDVSAYVKPITVHLGDSEEQPYIELGIEVRPDQSRLINEYYLEAIVFLLDKDLKPLHKTPIDLVPFGPNSPQRPIIPPDNKSHIIDTCRIQREEPEDSSGGLLSSVALGMPFDGVERISPDSYSKIHGFYVETKFACDGLPLKEDRRLLIFDSTIKNNEITTRSHEMTGWSKDCLVVSWFPVTDESGLYYKIVSFMNHMKFEAS